MNSKRMLEIVEQLVRDGLAERVSSPDRQTKAILFRLPNRRMFAVEIDKDADGQYIRQCKMVLEAQPSGTSLAWDEAAAIPGAQILDRQFNSSAYRTADAAPLAPGRQMSLLLHSEEAVAAILSWYGGLKSINIPAQSNLDPVPVWMVTSLWGQEDGLPRFVERGEWSLLYDSDSANNRRVREMQVGDRIFLKDFVPRAHDLPFDAQGAIVTANRFRAEGTITEASEDGLRVGVEWRVWDEPRTWYLYTGSHAVWRLRDPGESEAADRLRRFLLHGEPQDYQWFLSHPYWRDRLFGGSEDLSEKEVTVQPANLILYGPPGTGKTYATAREAVRLCGEAVPKDRGALMQRYEELSKEGRIRFVTFHQSFSYEEFVEGLRPSTGGNDVASGGEGTASGFELKVHDGIFKRIANDAAADTGGTEASDLLDQAKPVIRLGLPQANRNETFERFIGEGFIGWPHGGDYDWSAPEFEDWAAIKERRKYDEPELLGNNIKIHGTWLFRSSEIGTHVMLTSGWGKVHALGRIAGDYEYHPQAADDWARHRRRVEWLWHDADGVPRETIYPNSFTTFHAAYALEKQLINWDALNRLVFGDDAVVKAAAARRPYVLIIDEINRANVSKVFGELITLIEPDKRLGMPNALKVRLPYSKREFGVPANLHIVGTMNTADRSIALLDTALRRRFTFKEMPPRPDLLGKVEGIDLAAVLKAMNQRIEYLVDRDHRIGHAFFIDCKTKAEVDAVMRDKVIPLLQEYFFDDWNRLAAVLGEKQGKGGNFLECEALVDPTGEGRDPINSWRVREAFDAEAYERLIAGAAAQPAQAEGEA